MIDIRIRLLEKNLKSSRDFRHRNSNGHQGDLSTCPFLDLRFPGNGPVYCIALLSLTHCILFSLPEFLDHYVCGNYLHVDLGDTLWQKSTIECVCEDPVSFMPNQGFRIGKKCHSLLYKHVKCIDIYLQTTHHHTTCPTPHDTTRHHKAQNKTSHHTPHHTTPHNSTPHQTTTPHNTTEHNIIQYNKA